MGKAERIIALIERCLPLLEAFGEAMIPIIERLISLLEKEHNKDK